MAFPGLDGQIRRRPTAYVAALCAASVRTVNRWRRAGKIPPAPLLLLQLDAAGFLVPAFWQRRGALFAPDGTLCVGGYTFAIGELEGYGVILQTLRAIQQPSRAVDGAPRLRVLPGGLEDPGAAVAGAVREK